MISFKEYRKLTKTTSQNCLKICGIIFSVCFSIIYAITDALTSSLLHFSLMIIICIVLGNLFGVFIWLLAILSSFIKVKKMFKLIEEIPKDVRDRYNISLVLSTSDSRYNYPDCKIIGNKDDHTILFNSDKSNVFLKVLNYSGDCFVERMKRREWRSMTSTDFVEWIELVTDRHNS